MKRILMIAALSACVSAPALAGDVTPPTGAMFCETEDHLQEFMLAGVKGDSEWLAQLKDCAVLKGGVKIGIIEELPSDSTIGHVDKVRVIFRGVSAVGYMLMLDAK